MFGLIQPSPAQHSCLTLTSRELLNPPRKAVWISSHRLWTPPPSYNTQKQTHCFHYNVPIETNLAVVHWRVMKSMQNCDALVYLGLHRKQVLLRAGHLHGHIIPCILELGGVWGKDVFLSEEICLYQGNKMAGKTKCLYRLLVCIEK